tara:strand:+ start:5416 stop:5703 length:288 start_codon:yes stop_codon:yes gene_type:complete
MIKKIVLFLLIFIFAYCIVSNLIKKDNDKNNKSKNNKSKNIIHDPKKNKSFFIEGYNDNKISEIQLSLNKRNNIYEIKDNNLYKNGSLIQSLIIF